MPIDPKDLGRTYDRIVRVNSQSGKGGIAYLLQRDHGVTMPWRMQVEFSAIVQKMADSSETELTSTELWELFQHSYEERSLGGGAGAQALALVEVAWPGVAGSRFGAGSHANIVIASIQALLVAVSHFDHGVAQLAGD